MAQPRTFGTPDIRGDTIEELRISAQFYVQQLYNYLDELAGNRGTPTFRAPIDLGGNAVTNIADAEAGSQQAVSAAQTLLMSGSVFDAQMVSIANLPQGLNNTDAVNVEQLNQAIQAAVQQAIPPGVIVAWSGSVASIPQGWALCNGSNGTPDLRDRFIVGAGSTYTPGNTGGADSLNLAHTHASGTLATNTAGSHHHSPGTLATDVPTTTQVVQSGSGVTVAAQDHHHAITGVTSDDGTHGHDVTSGVTASSLSATTDIRPKYYAVCFIMKL